MVVFLRRKRLIGLKRVEGGVSRGGGTGNDANLPIVRPHNSKRAELKVEQPDKTAAEFWPIFFYS
jgi:hypothetical protein